MDTIRKELEKCEVDGVVETDNQLGVGSYGEVIELRIRGLRCAGKRLHRVLLKKHPNANELFLRECHVQSKLRHPNIVQFIGIHSKPVTTLIMEYLPMSLTTCLENYTTLPDYVESSILLDVATGLEFLHSQNPSIMHRDLTSNNILLTSNMVAKISDLGQAKIMCAEQTKAPGTPCYMPPEALAENPSYNTKLDIFSFGVMIVHVATHSWPIPQPTSATATEIDKRKAYFDMMDCNSPLTELARRCLHNDPTPRPDAAQLVQIIAESKPDPPYPNTLELQQALDAESKKCRHLEEHIHGIDLQLKTIQDEKPLLSSQLQDIVTSNESALVNACSHDLIVDYHFPACRTKSDIQLTLMSTAAASKPTTMELIVRTPLSIHFTGTLVRSIDSITTPWGMAVSKERRLFVVQNGTGGWTSGWNGILLYDHLGNRLGSCVSSLSKIDLISPNGFCWYPKSVAVDEDGIFFLVDTGCNRIQKFDLGSDFQSAECLESAGELGNKKMQFNSPIGIRVHRNGCIYVCDKNNNRIQVLDKELNFRECFGKEGDGLSDFLYPRDVDFDTQGRIYIVDCGHYMVKVFSPDWAYLGTIGGEGHGTGTFQEITSICIDKHNYIYATDKVWNCVQVFDPQWQFVMQIKLPFLNQSSTSEPVGIAVDDKGYLYVSCKASGCIYVYK